MRIPDHEFCRRILASLEAPWSRPRPTFPGEGDALQDCRTCAQEIIDGVDFVVNPRFEGKRPRKASSIIAFGEGGEVKIIRE